MIKIDIRAHKEAMEGLWDMEQTLKREREVQLAAVNQTRGAWTGPAAEALRYEYGNMLLYGEYQQTIDQVHGMRLIMEEAYPRLVYLKNKCENFHTCLTGEEPERWILGAYGTSASQLMVDRNYLPVLNQCYNSIFENNDRFYYALEDIMDQCAGIIDFSREREELERLHRDIARVRDLQDEINEYAYQLADLDADLSTQYEKWIDEDILAKADIPKRLDTLLGEDKESIALFLKLQNNKIFSDEVICYLAETYGTQIKHTAITWEEIALRAYADVLAKKGNLTLQEKEILQWGNEQLILSAISSSNNNNLKYAQAKLLLEKEEWTKNELSYLCSCLEEYAFLKDVDKLEAVSNYFVEATYIERETINGYKTFYQVSIKKEKLQKVIDAAAACGAQSLCHYASALKRMSIPSIDVKNAEKCGFGFEAQSQANGYCKLVLWVESDIDGCNPDVRYQRDMSVSKLTEDEIRMLSAEIDIYNLLERIASPEKSKAYEMKQELDNALRKIEREKTEQLIAELGIQEELPYMFGDAPYLAGTELAEWNAKREEALRHAEYLKNQNIDVEQLGEYYYYQCGLETIAASAQNAQEDPIERSIESWVLTYIGHLASDTYETKCILLGETIDNDIGWFVPQKKSQAIRQVVGENIREKVGGELGEYLENKYLEFMTKGDLTIAMGMDAITGAALADLISDIGKGVSKSVKAIGTLFQKTNNSTTDEVVEEVVEDVVKGGTVPVVKTQKNVEMPLLPEGSQWERNVLNSFAGGKSNPVTYGGGTTLYRVGGKNGGFWSLDSPPITEYQWRVDFAIKQEFCNDASTLYKMTIPEGSSLSGLEGTVGTQGMGLYGGAHQVYIDYRAVPSDWIEISPTNWK